MKVHKHGMYASLNDCGFVLNDSQLRILSIIPKLHTYA